MEQLNRITQQPDVMGGKACIRGMHVTVGMIVGQIGAGHSVSERPSRLMPVSPARNTLMSSAKPTRSAFAPLIVSSKIRSYPAYRLVLQSGG